MGKKGEGTFSEVLKAQDTKTGKYVAIKCMKNHFDTIEQVNDRFSIGCRSTTSGKSRLCGGFLHTPKSSSSTRCYSKTLSQ